MEVKANRDVINFPVFSKAHSELYIPFVTCIIGKKNKFRKKNIKIVQINLIVISLIYKK